MTVAVPEFQSQPTDGGSRLRPTHLDGLTAYFIETYFIETDEALALKTGHYAMETRNGEVAKFFRTGLGDWGYHGEALPELSERYLDWIKERIEGINDRLAVHRNTKTPAPDKKIEVNVDLADGTVEIKGVPEGYKVKSNVTYDYKQPFEVVPGQWYLHVKGKVYVVIAVAKHTEIDDQKLVIYHPKDDPDTIWARPLDIFRVRFSPLSGENSWTSENQWRRS